MENILDIVEEPGPDIKESNLIWHIWIHPTGCFKYILHKIPGKHVSTLFILGGVANAISRADDLNASDPLGFWGSFFLMIVGGVIGGLIGLYILAWATYATGQWLGSKATHTAVQSILAWSQIPSILAGVLSLILLVLIGTDIFSYDLEVENMVHSVFLIVFGLAAVALGIWSLVILAKGLAYAGEMSIGRAFLNAILPFLIIILIAMTAALLIYTLSGGN